MLVDVVEAGGVLVLSGAGLSTESGIPDYRGPTGLARRGSGTTPMTYQVFTGGADARRRYWARSHLGWRHIARAVPNAGIITQNVDGLHQAADSGAGPGVASAAGPVTGRAEVTELHGSLHRVLCLSCGQRTARSDLDRRLAAANPGWDPGSVSVNPDGDAALDDEAVASFGVADCAACGGVLKPDVVFFGENVPPARTRACYDLVEAASALVVLGSSLTVMSGFRYVRHAARLGRPVVIVNQGATRGDAYAAATLDAPLGQTLTALVAAL
jgi:NAD-dependent SIR2 family protein deacetylase